MRRFATLQRRLGPAMAVNRPGSDISHVVVALPSFSVGESLLSHYGDRIPALEHRYLLAALMLARIPACEMVFVSCAEPAADVVEHYLGLLPPAQRSDVRSRLHLLTVDDRTARPIAAKLLDRPDLVSSLRSLIGGRPAFLEPWNVTVAEVAVARTLDIPVNGTAPELWPLGFKSAGRRLFADNDIPRPFGVEDVRSVPEVLAAVESIRTARPDVPAVVVKTDDSGAGDGNVVLPLTGPNDLDDALRRLPTWYVQDLARGGVVEELVVGARFASPSVQVDVSPYGEVTVLATHEQVLSGPGGQVYAGCRFPADPEYSAELARHGRTVGEVLARQGVVGRLSVDFVAACDGSGSRRVFALEINLRKGGTTHPYAALRNLVPGGYDEQTGSWRTADGATRAYASTDNLLDPAWRGVPSRAVLRGIDAAGLTFDRRTGTGVVLHMLACLEIDGRCGLTAIGTDRADADRLYSAAGAVVAEVAAGSRSDSSLTRSQR